MAIGDCRTRCVLLLNKFDPGISLTAFGMDGCFQYVSQDLVTLVIAPGTTALSSFTIPNNPTLAGIRLLNQAAAYSPASIPNLLGASTSNGLELNLDLN